LRLNTTLIRRYLISQSSSPFVSRLFENPHFCHGLLKEGPMRCLECDAPMNRHAEKPMRATNGDNDPPFDSALGGVIASIHCCPECGNVETDFQNSASPRE
ncbi:MAG TPA: hypothetical protein VFY29_19315, partial [Terriglobia bacterium]|nr:hypothetical protein [Terriglobia bacterium]